MGDVFKKVASGEKLEISAQTYNAFLDAVRDSRSWRQDRDPRGGAFESGVVKMRNQTGVDQSRFAVLAFQDPIIGPSDNLAEFQSKVNFDGVLPGSEPRSQEFAILLEPLAVGKIGRGLVSGVTPVKVEIVRESDPFAEMVTGVTTHLRSAPRGGTRLLWKESGTGVKWAVVRLGDRPRFGIFELAGSWVAGTSGWAKMSGCKPVFYFDASSTYASDATEPPQTVWHAVGYPGAERALVTSLHQSSGRFPAKFSCGDWAWCLWNEHEARWQLLGEYEDHWRFELTAQLSPGGSASAKLVLWNGSSWSAENLTFTVHDSLGLLASSVSAGKRGVAKHYSDSCRWELVEIAAASSSGSNATHQESDGSPSVAATEVSYDQSTGLRMDDLGSGRVRVWLDSSVVNY